MDTSKGYKIGLGFAFAIIAIIKLVSVAPVVAFVVFCLAAGIAWGFVEDKIQTTPTQSANVCPACGSSNIQLVNETHTKGRGCLGSLFHFLIFFFIWWVWIFVWLFGGKKTINKTKAVCMTCGKQWYI